MKALAVVAACVLAVGALVLLYPNQRATLSKLPPNARPEEQSGETVQAATPTPSPEEDGRQPLLGDQQDDGKSPNQSASLEPQTLQESEIFTNLLSSIEGAVHERIDPGAIMKAAEIIASLKADKSAIPEPDPTGALRFPLLGTPAGITAELEVGRSNSPKYANVLCLAMKLPPPESPYFLNGVFRESPEVRITTWTDRDGKLVDFNIITSLKTAITTTEANGFSVGSGTINHGVLYYVNALTLESSLQGYGLQDGNYTSWKCPLIVDGEAWPRTDRIEQFSRGLLNMYSDIKAR